MSIRRSLNDKAGRPIVIRQADPGDAANLIGLSNRIRAEGVYFVADDPRLTADDYAEYLRLLDPERHLVLLAEQGGRVIGTVTAIAGGMHKTRHVVEIGIGVDAGWRGVGIGSALIGTALEWARQRDYLRAELSVFASNTRAIALYERFGFAAEGRRVAKYRIGDEYVDEILMGLLLR